MHATSWTSGSAPARRTALIVAAVVAAAALAAGAARVRPATEREATAAPAAVAMPAGSVDVSPVAGDPSVPSAASVFQGRVVSPEEPPASH